jgi:hypothetical protein
MAAEILASLNDVNTHLPDDKAKMKDSDDDLLQIDAARYIRSLLTGFFSVTTLNGWDTPANTPETIRGIAGRIIAAKYYATLYSEDIDTTSNYAQSLYNEANQMIDMIRVGTITVVDSSGNEVPTESGGALESDDFWPNDTTDGPFFTMGQVFG